MGRAWEAVFGNVDVLIEILLRLPAKSLLKFKCVSKHWRSIVSNPKFCRDYSLRCCHRNPHPVPTALFFSGDFMPSPHFEVVPLKIPGHGDDSLIKVPNFDYLDVFSVMILRSCNGLLLCSTKFLERESSASSTADDSLICYRRTDVDVYVIRYFVCNPTTKQFLAIPIPNLEIRKDRLDSVTGGLVFSLYLAFDPLKSPNFKVVCLRDLAFEFSRLRIDIYSSENDSWSDPKICFTAPRGMGIGAGVFCKGAVHWYSNDEHSFYFDVDNQCLRQMPMPQYTNYEIFPRIGYFGESRGHLQSVLFRGDSIKFKVYEIDDDYSQWLVRYTVDFDAIQSSLSDVIKDNLFSILYVVRGEEEEDLVIVLLVRGMVVSFNLRYQILEELQDLEPRGIMATSRYINTDTDVRSWFGLAQSGVFPYFESLLPF